MERVCVLGHNLAPPRTRIPALHRPLLGGNVVSTSTPLRVEPRAGMVMAAATGVATVSTAAGRKTGGALGTTPLVHLGGTTHRSCPMPPPAPRRPSVGTGSAPRIRESAARTLRLVGLAPGTTHAGKYRLIFWSVAMMMGRVTVFLGGLCRASFETSPACRRFIPHRLFSPLLLPTFPPLLRDKKT